MTDIILADGADTPVNHTFSVTRADGDANLYHNRAETFSAGRESLRTRLKETSTLRSAFATLVVPRVVEETVNGLTIKRTADFMTVKIEAHVPLSWESTDIEVSRVLGVNAGLHASFAAMVDDGVYPAA
jgi:hypothetical protein